MPYTKDELAGWVKSLGISEADQTILLDKLGAEAVLPKVGETILMRSEFSKKMNELQAEKTSLENDFKTRQEKEDQFRASLTGWKTEEEKKMEAAVAQARQDAADKLAAAQDKIRKLAETHGIPEADIKDLIAATPTTTRREDPPRDFVRSLDGKFVTPEQLRKEARFYAMIPGIQSKCEREYYRLFGTDAPDINWVDIIDKTEKEGKKLSEVFEATYKIPEKRAELAKVQHDKEIQAARDEGAKQERSKILAEHPDFNVRSVTRERPTSAVLDLARRDAAEAAKKDGGVKHEENLSRTAVEKAVEAFNSGKYKDGVEHAA